eukprot:XP_016657003.1 PREDICTED: jerky protein homolog-like [Acyrthosiphon pisum]
MSAKRKRVVLSLEKKMLIINRAVDHGESVQKLANKFSFISCAEVLAKKRKTMKNSSLSDMESALFEWFKQKRIEGIPISGPIVCEKAKWFKTRHGIRQLDIQGESLSGDLTAATLFNDEFNSLLSKLNLSTEQVYNTDESGLFWKMLPSKTLAAQSEKSAPGHKSSKERLTIMTYSNATGSHKIKLTVIGKAKKPRSFKGREMKYLPYDCHDESTIQAGFEKFIKHVKDEYQKEKLHEDVIAFFKYNASITAANCKKKYYDHQILIIEEMNKSEVYLDDIAWCCRKYRHVEEKGEPYSRSSSNGKTNILNDWADGIVGKYLSRT